MHIEGPPMSFFPGSMLGLALFLGVGSWFAPPMLAAGNGGGPPNAGHASSSEPWRALTGAPGKLELARGAVFGAPNGLSTSFDYTAQTTADECAGVCHTQQLLEWRDGEGSDLPEISIWDAQDAAGNVDPANTTAPGTLLALAWTDWEFQHEYASQPRINQLTCQRCHVPDLALEPRKSLGVYAPGTRGPGAANAAEGVTCVSCHLNGAGQINGDKYFPAAANQHEVQVSNAFDGVSLCASCHNDPLFGALTKTIEEYQAQAPGTNPLTCVDCHMSRTDNGQVGHTFLGGHSPSKRGKGLVATVPTTGSISANYVVSLQNQATYHNVPTGDTFRAFAVHLTLRDAANKIVLDKEIFVTQPVVTPNLTEVIKYEYIAPIAYGDTGYISFGKLAAGTYKQHVDLQYFQTKPTIVESRLTHKWTEVTAFGEANVKSWDQTLVIK